MSLDRNIMTPNLSLQKRKLLSVNPSEEMSWAGMEIQHTCHIGQWPSCEFNGLVEEMEDQFNRTSKHISNDFIVKLTKLGADGKSIKLGTHPRRGIGMVDFTVQANNIEFSLKRTKPKFENFKISDCKGCYGCNTGFSCLMKIKLIDPASYTVHLKSNSPFVEIENGGYNLKKMPEKVSKLIIKGFSLFKNTSVEVCVEESLNKEISDKPLCEVIELKLREPEHKLIKREEVITKLNDNYQSQPGNCDGISILGCMWNNFTNFWINIWNWLAHGLLYIRYVLYSIICFLTCSFVIYIIYVVLFKHVLKKKKPRLVKLQNIKKYYSKNPESTGKIDDIEKLEKMA